MSRLPDALEPAAHSLHHLCAAPCSLRWWCAPWPGG